MQNRKPTTRAPCADRHGGVHTFPGQHGDGDRPRIATVTYKSNPAADAQNKLSEGIFCNLGQGCSVKCGTGGRSGRTAKEQRRYLSKFPFMSGPPCLPGRRQNETPAAGTAAVGCLIRALGRPVPRSNRRVRPGGKRNSSASSPGSRSHFHNCRRIRASHLNDAAIVNGVWLKKPIGLGNRFCREGDNRQRSGCVTCGTRRFPGDRR
jgi:hypothetical protein